MPNELIPRVPPMMSRAGERLAKRTVPPTKYTDTRIGESDLYRATDPWREVFGGDEALGHLLHRKLDELLDQEAASQTRRTRLHRICDKVLDQEEEGEEIKPPSYGRDEGKCDECVIPSPKRQFLCDPIPFMTIGE